MVKNSVIADVWRAGNWKAIRCLGIIRDRRAPLGASHETLRRAAPLPLYFALLTVVAALPAQATVDITIDKQTIATVLEALSPERVDVPVPGGRTIEVRVSNLRVTGFTPTNGNQRGFINTSMTIRVPELGMVLPVEPRVTFDVIKRKDTKLARMSFRDVNIKIPLLGAIDISGFLQPVIFPAEYFSLTKGSRGDVEIVSELVDVQMGARAIRLRFDVRVTSIGGAAVAP